MPAFMADRMAHMERMVEDMAYLHGEGSEQHVAALRSLVYALGMLVRAESVWTEGDMLVGQLAGGMVFGVVERSSCPEGRAVASVTWEVHS